MSVLSDTVARLESQQAQAREQLTLQREQLAAQAVLLQQLLDTLQQRDAGLSRTAGERDSERDERERMLRQERDEHERVERQEREEDREERERIERNRRSEEALALAASRQVRELPTQPQVRDTPQAQQVQRPLFVSPLASLYVRDDVIAPSSDAPAQQPITTHATAVATTGATDSSQSQVALSMAHSMRTLNANLNLMGLDEASIIKFADGYEHYAISFEAMGVQGTPRPPQSFITPAHAVPIRDHHKLTQEQWQAMSAKAALTALYALHNVRDGHGWRKWENSLVGMDPSGGLDSLVKYRQYFGHKVLFLGLEYTRGDAKLLAKLFAQRLQPPELAAYVGSRSPSDWQQAAQYALVDINTYQPLARHRARAPWEYRERQSGEPHGFYHRAGRQRQAEDDGRAVRIQQLHHGEPGYRRERGYSPHHERRRSNSPFERHQGFARREQSPRYDRNPVQRHESSSRNRDDKCRACGRAGHYARDCPNEQGSTSQHVTTGKPHPTAPNGLPMPYVPKIRAMATQLLAMLDDAPNATPIKGVVFESPVASAMENGMRAIEPERSELLISDGEDESDGSNGYYGSDGDYYA